MEDLIEALQIFAKYTDTLYPTGCQHDILYVYVSPQVVAPDDRVRLYELGFVPGNDEGDNDDDCEWWISYRYGSA